MADPTPVSGSSSTPVPTPRSSRTTARSNSTISSSVTDSGSAGRSSLRRTYRWSRARTVNAPRVGMIIPTRAAARVEAADRPEEVLHRADGSRGRTCGRARTARTCARNTHTGARSALTSRADPAHDARDAESERRTPRPLAGRRVRLLPHASVLPVDPAQAGGSRDARRLHAAPDVLPGCCRWRSPRWRRCRSSRYSARGTTWCGRTSPSAARRTTRSSWGSRSPWARGAPTGPCEVPSRCFGNPDHETPFRS